MQQAINKSDFISNLASSYNERMFGTDSFLDDEKVGEMVRHILGLMMTTLAQDGRVEVRGFGSFCLHHRAARMGRNPKTGDRVSVSAKAIPYFKPGKALREAVDNK